MASDEIVLTMTNLIMCGIGGLVYLCRMSKMSAQATKLGIRVQCTLWFTFFATSGWSFLFGHTPNITQFLLTAIAFVATLVGSPAWRSGAPTYTVKL